MDFGFNEAERAFQQTVRRFALERAAPLAPAWDRGEPPSREFIKEYGALGVAALRIPEQYGGVPSSWVMVGIACEETGRASLSLATLAWQAAMFADIAENADERIRSEWLPRLATLDACPSLAVTEPGVGSDAANMTTRAVRDGNEWVINGEKSSITLTGLADFNTLFCRTGGPGARGISAIFVPLDTPGVSRVVYDNPGDAFARRGSFYFDNARVPDYHLIGEEGRGFHQVMAAFDTNRALISLACVGSALQSLDEAIAYVQERHAFGKPLAKYEGVSFQIAEYLTRVEGARLLCYRVLWLTDRGEKHTKEAAMAKLITPIVTYDAVHSCLLLHGHFGYSREMPYDMRMRDILAQQLGDGTREITSLVIAREAIGQVAVPYR